MVVDKKEIMDTLEKMFATILQAYYGVQVKT